MLSKKELKQKLLNTGYFEDNIYLNKYLSFLLYYSANLTEHYCEKHHIIPVAAYMPDSCEKYNRWEAQKLANADTNNFTVKLLYKDHAKAHYLLYFCTKGRVKRANSTTLRWFFDKVSKESSKQLRTKYSITNKDLNYIQRLMDEVKFDADNHFWTKEEIEFLNYNYKAHGAKYCIRHLTRHTSHSVWDKITSLKLEARVPMKTLYWTEAELKFLEENYIKFGRAFCVRSEFLLKRHTAHAIENKAHHLKICSDNNLWTENEIVLLKNIYQSQGFKACTQSVELARHGPQGIKQKIKEIGFNLDRRRKVICVETRQIWESLRQASIELGMNTTALTTRIDRDLPIELDGNYIHLQFIK